MSDNEVVIKVEVFKVPCSHCLFCPLPINPNDLVTFPLFARILTSKYVVTVTLIYNHNLINVLCLWHGQISEQCVDLLTVSVHLLKKFTIHQVVIFLLEMLYRYG